MTLVFCVLSTVVFLLLFVLSAGHRCIDIFVRGILFMMLVYGTVVSLSEIGFIVPNKPLPTLEQILKK